MTQRRTAQDVFEAWGKDYHADGMETEHWPRVRQIHDLVQPSAGHYLEVGIGNGYSLVHMATHQFANGRCLGMDFSTSMVERARVRTSGLANVEVVPADFLAWDPQGQRFDMIFSMEVFYYFADISAGIQKAWSILNPTGKLWVAVNFYEENEQSSDWPDRLGTPMTRWSAKDYVSGFENAGFTSVGQRMVSAPVPEGSEHGDAPTLLTFGTKP